MDLTRRSFTRLFSSSHVLSLHTRNIYAKKQGIAKNHPDDPCYHDFSRSSRDGTASRCRSRDNLSTIDEVFADCAFPTPPGPLPLCGPGYNQNNCADVCGFLNPRGSQRF